MIESVDPSFSCLFATITDYETRPSNRGFDCNIGLFPVVKTQSTAPFFVGEPLSSEGPCMSTATQPLVVPREGLGALARDYAELTKARVTTLIVMTAWCGVYFAAAKSGVSSLSWTVLNALRRHRAGQRRHRRPQRSHGARPRCAHAAHRHASAGDRQHERAARLGRRLRHDHWRHAVSVAHHQLADRALDGAHLGLSYLLVYTPMKLVHPICTFLGAFPGAMPPVLGWTAIRGRLDAEAFVLFAIMFLWQFPHFHSIAWLYREDYETRGVRMLPVVESDGRSTAFAIVFYALALVPVTLAPTLMGMSGWTYFAGALAAGLRPAVVQRAHVDHEACAHCCRNRRFAPAICCRRPSSICHCCSR